MYIIRSGKNYKWTAGSRPFWTNRLLLFLQSIKCRCKQRYIRRYKPARTMSDVSFWWANDFHLILLISVFADLLFCHPMAMLKEEMEKFSKYQVLQTFSTFLRDYNKVWQRSFEWCLLSKEIFYMIFIRKMCGILEAIPIYAGKCGEHISNQIEHPNKLTKTIGTHTKPKIPHLNANLMKKKFQADRDICEIG